MPESYQKTIQVMEPECDYHQKIFLSQLMRHAQEMGSEHLLHRGIDYNQMYRDGMVFLVNKLLIKITRRPTFGEQVVLTTVPMKPKGAQFIRDTYFDTPEGERLVEVSISWMLINPETRKILRPAAFEVYGFEMYPNDGEYITRYRIKRPQGQATTHLRQIKYTDLDYNHHVNNAVYADIVCDVLPERVMLKREPRQFGIMFEKEARLGQIVEIDAVQFQQPNGELGYYVGGQVNGGHCFEAELLF